jgi:hypothetical protein
MSFAQVWVSLQRFGVVQNERQKRNFTLNSTHNGPHIASPSVPAHRRVLHNIPQLPGSNLQQDRDQSHKAGVHTWAIVHCPVRVRRCEDAKLCMREGKRTTPNITYRTSSMKAYASDLLVFVPDFFNKVAQYVASTVLHDAITCHMHRGHGEVWHTLS